MSANHESTITRLRELPKNLETAVNGLTDDQLDTPYGEGKWTVRQVVHHLVDSHINGYIRFRQIMTEDHPTLNPYDQDTWAVLHDARTLPIEVSLRTLSGLHERICALLESISDKDWKRTAFHPEIGDVTLESYLPAYADHGEQHLKQITDLKARQGW